MRPPPKDASQGLTAPPNARASYTITYSRTTTPKRKERAPDTESLKWTRFYVTTADPSDDDPGCIEEAQFALEGDEIVDDPASIARRLLRKQVVKRPKPLVFPDMGVA